MKIVITGTSSGIGRSLAQHYCEAGMKSGALPAATKRLRGERSAHASLSALLVLMLRNGINLRNGNGK